MLFYKLNKFLLNYPYLKVYQVLRLSDDAELPAEVEVLFGGRALPTPLCHQMHFVTDGGEVVTVDREDFCRKTPWAFILTEDVAAGRRFVVLAPPRRLRDKTRRTVFCELQAGWNRDEKTDDMKAACVRTYVPCRMNLRYIIVTT